MLDCDYRRSRAMAMGLVECLCKEWEASCYCYRRVRSCRGAGEATAGETVKASGRRGLESNTLVRWALSLLKPMLRNGVSLP